VVGWDIVKTRPCVAVVLTARRNTKLTANPESDVLPTDRSRHESTNPVSAFRGDVRQADDVAEDLSRPSSTSYRPTAHAGIVGLVSSARHPDDIPSPMILPPPAHSHHRRTDDHVLADGGMRHRSPARNMPPSPRGTAGYAIVGDHHDAPTPRDEIPWSSRRSVPPPLPYLPPTVASTTAGVVPKFGASGSGPPPLIHEPVKGGAGSIVLGTPLSPEQRRRHFDLTPSAVGMLYKTGGGDPRSGFGGPLITQPPPAPQDGQFPIIPRQTGVPWPPPPMPVGPASDATVPTSSRDLLYGDLITARQMHRGQVDPDRRRASPRSSYPSPSWQQSCRTGGLPPESTSPRYLDEVRRASILNTMLPWPVRPQANVTRYSVCGEPSRQCYTPPLPIQKAFISRDQAPRLDQPPRPINADFPTSGRIPDSGRGGVGPKMSPHFKDAAADCRRGDLRHSPPEIGPHQPEKHGPPQSSPVTAAASEKLTAANLIDAIIIEQINNQDAAVPPPMKPTVSPGHAAGVSILERLSVETSTDPAATSTAPGLAPLLCSLPATEKAHRQSAKSPAGVAMQSGQKDLTLGEHIHSIIVHDFQRRDAGGVVEGSAFGAAAVSGKVERFCCILFLF